MGTTKFCYKSKTKKKNKRSFRLRNICNLAINKKSKSKKILETSTNPYETYETWCEYIQSKENSYSSDFDDWCTTAADHSKKVRENIKLRDLMKPFKFKNPNCTSLHVQNRLMILGLHEKQQQLFEYFLNEMI